MRAALLLLALILCNNPGVAYGADAASGTPAQEAPRPGTASDACGRSESWSLPGAIGAEASDGFHSFLGGRLAPVRAFGEALALRRTAASPEEKYFAEYWASRALLAGGLVQVARDGFTVLAARPVSEATAGIQLAAVACLAWVHSRYPAIPVARPVFHRLPDYEGFTRKRGGMGPLRDLAALALIEGLKATDDDSDTGKALELLAGSPHESLVRGVMASRRFQHFEAIKRLKDYLAGDGPASLERYVDTAHLLLARSLYTIGQFDGAIAEYKHISRGSNELAIALSELSWAYLMAGRYGEAVGAAISLTVGGLRHTFVPEAQMVMAMALNEICQYPQSLRAAEAFRKTYEKPYRWLQTGQGRVDPYKLAVHYLRETRGEAKKSAEESAPERIASEWVRSPVFIADQDRINLILDERESATQLTHSGSLEATQLAQRILTALATLKPAVHQARQALGPGKPLPQELRDGLMKLRLGLLHYRRLQRAAPAWRSVLSSYRAKLPGLERKLIAEIQNDLRDRSGRMLEQLEEIADNIQLIEVEIYNGASADIVWQNAHPDFRKMARDLADPEEKVSAAKVWDWGRLSTSGDDGNEGGEVWEDELGSFKADVVDNCSSKDRYVALRLNSKGNRHLASDPAR